MPTFTGGSGGTGATTFGQPTSLNQPIIQPGAQGNATFGAAWRSPGPSTTLPNYVKGDEWGPVSDPNPDNIRQLQIQMVEAGLLTMSKVHLGIWDAYSAGGYAKVLAYANSSGQPASAALDQYVASSAKLPSAAINQDDLGAMAQNVSQNVLGRNLNPDELARFSTAFQAAMAAQPDGGPSTAAGVSYLGQQVLTKERPQEAASASLHDVSRRAMQILSQPAVSLPSPQ
jgi:hypothetical protein